MDLQLRGTTALVTGAGSGIGRAVALALAAEGVRLALLDRDEAGLRETAELVNGEEERQDALMLVADVTDEAQVAAAVGAVDRLDAVVCCAGISGPVGSGIEDVTLAQWNAVLAVNVTGPFLVLKHALPALRAAGAASVVLISSDSAVVASPGMVPYCTSKAALVQFARALSVDLAGTGIRVNTVAPSVVDTPMSRGDLGDSAFDAPGFPVQSGDEVAAHVAYLASPRSRAVNGTTVLSDFGYSARSGFPA
ncbi:MAG: SDR family oxidoreductase [Microbacterium sp.]|nr:SDR family oxidoreductase [Microbacterium sp.]